MRLRRILERNYDAAKVEALGRSQAVIEFDLDGNILSANDNFLQVVGYELPEIVGRHHRMFVDATEASGSAYQEFWAALKRGEFQSAEYRRLAKDGREVWIQATYNPILDRRGRPERIVKFATDVTEQKHHAADVAGQLAAIGKSQAVIEFGLDGKILTANTNFLEAVGYTLSEIQGQHHRMFVRPEDQDSSEYQTFWERLGRGEYQSGVYERFVKGGRAIWLQATYNPILDANGRPFKIVKFATDVTAIRGKSVDTAGQIAAISKSQAVIEFAMDGTILQANDNFLKAFGYTLEEIKGRNHRMCVDPNYAAGPEYAAFWAALNRGEYQAAEYKRLAKGGREVWIQASYNPILDLRGKPFKVVKHATDVTARVAAQQGGLASAENAAGNVNAVAAATEQITASVTEISENMSKASTLVEEMYERAGKANELTGSLSEAARSMTGITKLIQQIANQITLLSLNATIEAARAGESGKGFAVVAGEVKSLASQTANATGQISREIEEMQARSRAVASTLGEISSSVGAVREFVTGVAGAVVEQRAAIQGIAQNMQDAASEVTEIAGYIGNMGGTALAHG